MNTDSAIYETIVDALSWDIAIDSSRLTVTVKDRIATIEGEVRSHSDKLEARRAAQCAAGVRAVIIRIEVLPMNAGYFQSDAQGFNCMTFAAVCD